MNAPKDRVVIIAAAILREGTHVFVVRGIMPQRMDAGV